VHLADENSDKGKMTNDAHRSQTSKHATQLVTNHADTTEKAFHGALDKIKVLDTSSKKESVLNIAFIQQKMTLSYGDSVIFFVKNL
jgi:hypothetical protein